MSLEQVMVEQVSSLKTGVKYKDTSIGEIPVDWSLKNIEETCEILDNKRVPLNKEQREKMKGYIPYYGANGVVDHINDYIFEDNLILIAEDGGYFDEYMHRPIAYLIHGKSWVNNHAHVLKVIEPNDTSWIYYSLVNKNIIPFIKGGTRSKLNQTDLRQIAIPIPPCPEQKKIADILTTVDEAIEKATQIIKKAKELKKGLMQRLLNRGIGHNKFKKTEIGKIPVDWEVKRLIDTASNDKYSFTGGPFGSDLKENSYTDHGVRIIQLQNIGDGEFLGDYKIFTSEEKANQLKNCNIYPGDIIIAKMADPVARACIIPDIDNRYLMASDGIRLSINEKEHDVNFILYAINSTYFRKNAERHSTGTTRLRIGLTELKNLPIGIPPLEEQKKIAQILSSVDDELERESEHKERLELLKRGLIQVLLTGKIRVAV